MSSDLAAARARVRPLISLVRAGYVPDSPTHDHSHLERVAALASRICAAEGGDQLVTLSAAWLHDLHREARPREERFFVPPEAMDERAETLLNKADIPVAVHRDILEAIHYTDRYSFSDRPTFEKAAAEARAVRDADCLDAIGAIGIARSFSFGGAHGIPLWVSDAPSNSDTYFQGERPPSTIQHFYDKLLRLPGELETPTAIMLARKRDAYMRSFVAEFMEEWDEDLPAGQLTSVKAASSKK
ncbi:MAG TPA: HD domain-containing protein [Streptosporangiaceae bacterium]|nr:HD domain-containing protein [Streptosporangiaceae bacterium]